MNYFLKDLTAEQRCAMVGIAFDLCRSNHPSKESLAKIEHILNDFCEELGLSQSEGLAFVKKMMENGVLNMRSTFSKLLKISAILDLYTPIFIVLLHQ